jgi:YgiT-type zinc finger domain-containing protein
MNRNSTLSSRAKGPSRQIETRYEKCPLCGSRDIHLGHEVITANDLHHHPIKLDVRRWKCEHCGESFLTSDARRQMDKMLQLAASA